MPTNKTTYKKHCATKKNINEEIDPQREKGNRINESASNVLEGRARWKGSAKQKGNITIDPKNKDSYQFTYGGFAVNQQCRIGLYPTETSV